MQKKDYRQTLSVIASLALILFFLITSIHFWCFNQAFYDSEHAKLTLYGKSISEHIGITDEQLKDLTAFTLAYLNDEDASLDLKMEVKGAMREVYTDDEKAHMIDVRHLNLIANRLWVVSLLIVTGYLAFCLIRKLPLDDFYRSYMKVLKYGLIFLAVLGTWILIDFDSFWTAFHHVFFAGNELWILDLRKDILIMIVPPEFFNHLVITITVTFFILLLFPVLLYMFIKRKSA